MLSGLWPTIDEAIPVGESVDDSEVWLVAVTVSDLDEYVEDALYYRGNPESWRRDHFDKIEQTDLSQGWALLGYDVANSWLNVNFIRNTFDPLPTYEEAEAHRLAIQENDEFELFIFGLYRRDT